MVAEVHLQGCEKPAMNTHRLVLLARNVGDTVLLKVLVYADVITAIALVVEEVDRSDFHGHSSSSPQSQPTYRPRSLLRTVQDNLNGRLDVVPLSTTQDFDSIGKLKESMRVISVLLSRHEPRHKLTAELLPCAQQLPQYWGICWLMFGVTRFFPLTFRQSRAVGTASGAMRSCS